jgi:hypothetical protein
VSGPENEFGEEELELEGREDAESSLPEGDLQHYDGKWVAVRDGVVVASADDEETLREDPAVQEGDDVYPIGDPPSGFYFIEGSV